MQTIFEWFAVITIPCLIVFLVRRKMKNKPKTPPPPPPQEIRMEVVTEKTILAQIASDIRLGLVVLVILNCITTCQSCRSADALNSEWTIRPINRFTTSR